MDAAGWPFVGRDDEVRTIVSAYHRRDTAGVVLVGGAGVGKTRLAREVVSRLAGEGRRTEWVTATRSAAAIPFGAVSHLLPPDRVLEGGRLAAMVGAADSFAAGMADGYRTVVGVDDAHLLDDPSAALMHHLAARDMAFVVMTVRSGEPTTDAVRSLWQEDLAGRVELEPLGRPALDALIDHAVGSLAVGSLAVGSPAVGSPAVGGRLDAVSRLELHRVCAGNPLLLRELLRAGAETGVLRQQAGVWRWAGGLRMTTRLSEVVAVRLDAVTGEVRDTLELVACGEPLSFPLLEGLVGVDAAVAAERTGLAVAERAGLRVVARLAHPLYGEVIRATLAPARARQIWGRLAAAITRTPMRRRDDHLLAGVWHLRAGRGADPGLLVTAARRASARYDLDLAESLARAARQAGGGWPADHVLAEILEQHGRYEEAAGVLPDPPAGGGAELVRWAVTRARVLYWGLDQVDEAEHLLVETARRVDDAAAAAALHCWILLFDGRCREAVEAGGAVLASDPDRAGAASVVRASAGVTAASGVLGQFRGALAAHRRGGDSAHKLHCDWPWGDIEVGYHISSCLAHLLAGRVDDAWAMADQGFAAAARDGATTMAGMWTLYRGVVAKVQGRVLVAASALREAIALLQGFDTYRMARLCLGELGGAIALSGDAGEAAAWLARADRRRRRASRLWEAWVELDRAWVYAAGGDIAAAATQARYAAGLARGSGQPTVEAMALYDAARLGDAGAVHVRLAELARLIEGTMCAALAEAASALARRDGDGLDKATTGLVETGLRLHAAETATAAARAHRRAGHQHRAVSAQEQAAALAAACPGAVTPLLELPDPLAGLTRRERDVARLAATGGSSQQIAGALHLSVRTVNNHLGRVYAKLGLAGRQDLVHLLGGGE